MNVRVYLAGPEVFLSNAREIGALKRAICERHGLVGVFPADEEDDFDPASSLGQQALAISRAMERVMRGYSTISTGVSKPVAIYFGTALLAALFRRPSGRCRGGRGVAMPPPLRRLITMVHSRYRWRAYSCCSE